MAQTKAGSTRSKTKSSKSRSSAASKSRNGASAQSKRSPSSRSRSSSSSKRPSSQRRPASAGQRTSRESRSGTSASRDGSDKSKLAAFAAKAKAPAAAGGAALLGIAGGVALSRTKRRKGILGRMPKPNVKMPKVKASKMNMPKPDSALKAVGSAAGEVADRSQRLGQVAAEVQKVSDAIANSNSKK
jgi:trimeric autotransporter adhesin